MALALTATGLEAPPLQPRQKRAGHTPLELAGVTDAPTLAEALNQLGAGQPIAVSQPAKCFTFAEIFGLAVEEPASLQFA